MGLRRVLESIVVLGVTACPGPEPAPAPAEPASADEPTPAPAPTPASTPTPRARPSTPIGDLVAEITKRAELDVPADFDRRFIGKWKSENWSPSYEIRAVDGEVIVTAQDDSDGEQFEVSEISWTPTTLEATFRMPSTDHTTHAVLRLVGDSRIQEQFSGPVGGTDHWRRVE